MLYGEPIQSINSQQNSPSSNKSNPYTNGKVTFKIKKPDETSSIVNE